MNVYLDTYRYTCILSCDKNISLIVYLGQKTFAVYLTIYCRATQCFENNKYLVILY